MTRTKETMVVIALCLGNLFLTGMGMGVPILTIFWGAAAGLAAILTTRRDGLAALVRKTWFYGGILVGFTFLTELALMAGPSIAMARGRIDPANFGHPFILYDPLLSFWAFVLVEVIVAPVLEILVTLATVFVYVSVSRRFRQPGRD